THLARLRITIDFGPGLSWVTLGQWDDVTDSLGINSRLRWILEPGRDLFFVLDHFLEDDPSGSLQAAESALTLKSLYTFRF
ncbi:MAG: hydrolase, partial [Thermoanaerobaculia bacterium]